jgi:hypothetical protein
MIKSLHSAQTSLYAHIFLPLGSHKKTFLSCVTAAAALLPLLTPVCSLDCYLEWKERLAPVP